VPPSCGTPITAASASGAADGSGDVASRKNGIWP